MSLAARSINAIQSNYVGTLVRVGAQFVAQIVIMRELGPELVGTFGYALLLYGVLALAIDQGFGWSLIQANFDDDKEISVVFSRLMLASLLAMIGVFAMSYPIERYLDNYLVGDVFRYSAPSYLLVGLFVVSQARLRADLRFREIQIATTGSYLLAYPVVGVAMAMSGFGVWALLAAWYTQAVFQILVAYRYSPHLLKLSNPFVPTTSGPLGRHVAGINLLNWAVDNSAGLFVGGMGAAALGNFNAASTLARTPALQLVQNFQSILFSTASAIGSEKGKIRRLYLGTLAALSFILVPAYVYAASRADLIIGLLFGEKWSSASGIFAVLSVGVIAMATGMIAGAILSATGRQGVVLQSQLACLAIMLFGLYFATRIGLTYVGLAIAVAYCFRFVLQTGAMANAVDATFADLARVLRGPFAIALVMAAPVAAILPVSLGKTVAESTGLLCQIAVAMLLIGMFPRFFLSSALVEVLTRFASGRWLVRKCGLEELA